MDTFTPPVDPSQSGSSKSTNANVNAAQFGDGYSQRVRNGLNPIVRTLNLSWEFLEVEDAQAMDSFFESQGGDKAFLYQVTGDPIERMWTCNSWKNGYDGGRVGSYSATFVEAFDIA